MNRLISWFVKNPIAANMLMILIVAGGLSSMSRLNKEVFPVAGIEIVTVTVPYPGAGPKEVEEQISIRIEEAIADLVGIKEIRSTSKENLATVSIEVTTGYDAQKLLNDVKTRVEAISSFPQNAERVQVSTTLLRSPIMSLSLHGSANESTLKREAKKLRDNLVLLAPVNSVDIQATRVDEIAIEIPEANLRSYNLSLNEIAQKIRNNSVNLPAGTVRSDSGDIQIQTRGQAYRANDFSEIVIVSDSNGMELKLEEIAEIRDSFAEVDILARFNGERAVFLELYMTENPDILTATETVKAYIQANKHALPPDITLSISRDWSVLFKGRMNLLLKNALTGLSLVFLVLMLFLRPSLSFWVCVGIAVAFMGAIWILPLTGISVNMISMFAFILVLGIVVDDAIIVGESIYATHQYRGENGSRAASRGALTVSKPVLFAVISTMIFFAPMLVLPGVMGDIAKSIPIVVLLCLTFSLVESLLILPAHLSNIKPEKTSSFSSINRLNKIRKAFSSTLQHFSETKFQKLLSWAMAHSASTVSLFFGIFFITIAFFGGGWLKQSFMPIVPSDFIRLHVQMPEGAAFNQVEHTVQRIERAIEQLKKDPSLLKTNNNQNFINNVQVRGESNNIFATIAMINAENRELGVEETSRTLRELIGEIPEAEKFSLRYTINTLSEDIRFLISIYNDNRQQLERATGTIKEVLASYPGVYDVKDSFETSKLEVEITLKPHANVMGIDLSSIAKQVRQGFYGEEVQRVARNGEDVKVMIRYPLAERQAYSFLEGMRVRSSAGREIALAEVADIKFVPAYASITREGRKRIYTITAEVDESENNAELIIKDIFDQHIDKWKLDFPGFALEVGGDKRDQSEFIDSITKNFFLALILIYGLMAIAFRSYSQPFLILTAVPFGFTGAILGHIIMDREVSMLSLLGFLACAGVVVNDNLVLLDRINRLREEGLTPWRATLQAAHDRFRPIVLTSITTFVGLLPMMSEQSTQARFLIPMAISLSFGVLFATLVTLILVPCLYYAGTRVHLYVYNCFKSIVSS